MRTYASLFSRRRFAFQMANGFLGSALGALWAQDGKMPEARLAQAPKAKSVIYLFLCGGPSQPDLWDLKPEAPAGVRSVFDSIETTVPGIRFGALIPQVASAHA